MENPVDGDGVDVSGDEDGDGGDSASEVSRTGEANLCPHDVTEPCIFGPEKNGEFREKGLTFAMSTLRNVKSSRGPNQDAMFVSPSRTVGGTFLFGVFDGHGEGGEHWSSSACREMTWRIEEEHQLRDDGPAEVIPRDLDEGLQNFDVGHLSKSSSPTGGSCALLLVAKKRGFLFSSIGDSRLVVDGEQVNPVPKCSDDEERARIEERGAFVTPNGRLCGLLAVPRALGNTGLKITQAECEDDDVSRCTQFLTDREAPVILINTPCSGSIPNDGVELIIMCSDGLIPDAMTPPEATEFVHGNLAARPGPVTPAKLQDAADALVARGRQKGSVDDISVILVMRTQ